MNLLATVAKTGRRYKELLCKCDTPDYVVQSLGKLAPLNVQDAAKALLSELCVGNPAYDRATLDVLARALARLPDDGRITIASVLDAALERLAHYDELTQAILVSLIGMLCTLPAKTAPEDERARSEAELLAICTQAGSAKALALLIEDQPPLAIDMIERGALQAVLRLIGRVQDNKEAQEQAVEAARLMLEQCPVALQAVEDALGREMLIDLMGDRYYLKEGLSPLQANLFLSCTLRGQLV